MTAERVDRWIDALLERQTRVLSRPELLKAVRALSARYVERRASLAAGRSPLDSAGKRAAFAAFFAPLHFVVVHHVVRALSATAGDLRQIVDLGCGTGTASAAWALSFDDAPAILGVDRNAWALGEAVWNWRTLGLRGRTRRDHLERVIDETARWPRRDRVTSAILLAWSLNELDERRRAPLLPRLLSATAAGTAVLVVEPLATSVVPWWDPWAEAFVAAGGRADEWKNDASLPPALAEINRAAGFRPRSIGARTLWARGSTTGRA